MTQQYIPIYGERIPDGWAPWRRDPDGVLWAVSEAATAAEVDQLDAEEEIEAEQDEILFELEAARLQGLHKFTTEELDDMIQRGMEAGL